MNKPERHLVTISFIIFLFLLPIGNMGCSKKDDPNVTYDSEESKNQTNQSRIQEMDIDEREPSSGNIRLKGLKSVFFDYDSAQLTQSTRQSLKNNVDFLKNNSAPEFSKILVEGHCDERGSTEYNLALGERRANSVRDFLVNSGIAKNRLKVISYGEEKPAVMGQDESAFARNRRVEFTQSSGGNLSMAD